MNSPDLTWIISTAVGAIGGALGAYVAIRERLTILETKLSSEIGAIYKHLGSLETNANRAHLRIDTMREGR